MSDITQIDEYVDAAVHCLSERIKDCSVEWKQTLTSYIFTIKVSLNSKYVMECDVREEVNYVQAWMRIGYSPEDLADILFTKFFGNMLRHQYTDAGIEALNRIYLGE